MMGVTAERARDAEADQGASFALDDEWVDLVNSYNN
jgi:hypothetical protein